MCTFCVYEGEMAKTTHHRPNFMVQSLIWFACTSWYTRDISSYDPVFWARLPPPHFGPVLGRPNWAGKIGPVLDRFLGPVKQGRIWTIFGPPLAQYGTNIDIIGPGWAGFGPDLFGPELGPNWARALDRIWTVEMDRIWTRFNGPNAAHFHGPNAAQMHGPNSGPIRAQLYRSKSGPFFWSLAHWRC